MNKVTRVIGGGLLGVGAMAGAFKLAEKMEGAGEASKLAALSVLATPIQEGSNQEIKCRGNDTLLPASDYRIVKTDSSYYLVDGENRYYWTETCDLVEEVD